MKRRRHSVLLALACCGFVIAVSFVIGPAAEIRTGTGDLCYSYLGAPITYHLTPEPERSQLTALAAGSNSTKPRWCNCATHVGTNNADWMCQGFYRKAAAWIAVDPNLARMIVTDIDTYVRDTGGWHGLPASFPMLAFVIHRDTDGNYRVNSDWQQYPEVVDYLHSKRYALPATRQGGG